VQNVFHEILNFFDLNLNFFIFLDRFDVLMLKIIFKNKKKYFNIFLDKKTF
jgi:hypothetical protein